MTAAPLRGLTVPGPARWPLLLAQACLALALVAELAAVLAATGGSWVYPLDDAYIHLAMAKNVAGHGVFGVTPHAFTSSSSSPLWLALLSAVVLVTGKVVWPPLVMAALSAAAVVDVADRVLRAAGATAWQRAVGLVFLVFAVPLPALALTGMEHCLHALLVLLLVERLVVAADADDPAAAKKALRAALWLLPLAVATRFETLFVVAPAGLLLWHRVGWRAMVLLGAAAALPVVAFGIWSVSQGQFFLPTSILLKSSAMPVPGLRAHAPAWMRVITELVGRSHVGALFVASAFALCWRGGPAHARRRLLLVLAALVLHAGFARFGSFFRYEGYLMAAGLAASLPAVLRGLAAAGLARLFAWLVLLLLVGATFNRGYRALRDPAQASRHTFLQNLQVGRFLAENCAGRGVAVNDIGAVCFVADIRLLDLVGLADVEVARAIRAGAFDAGFVAELARRRGVEVAVVYENWFPGGLPPGWQRLATWTVERPFWGPTVTFFATEPTAAPRLREALSTFHATLPAGVVVR